MEYIVICSVAFIVSILTFFSGFGIGTLLMPAFAIFFPVSVAVALTAVVHFFNNILKVGLLGRQADKVMILRFGIPAVIAAFLGAQLLLMLAQLTPLFSYNLFGHEFSVTPINLVIAGILAFFAFFETLPVLKGFSFGRKHLIIGGILSGFFGGLSGHQGAFRSAFLVKTGIAKESYVATGAVVSAFVDITRLLVYRNIFVNINMRENGLLLFVVIISALMGVIIGKRLLHKVTMSTVQFIVTGMLLFIALGLGTGII